jgi:hypothetical protein
MRDDEGPGAVSTSRSPGGGQRSTWERVAPRGWPLFAFEWGFRWGLRTMDFSASRHGAFGVHMERSALAEAVGREVACRSCGHPRCTFVVVGPTRRAALDVAISRGGGDVARVLAALHAPRPG